MKSSFPLARVALASVLLASGGFVLAQHASPAKAGSGARHPILVIDQHAIMTESKLGQDIHRQLNDYEDKIQADMGSQGQTLQNEMQTVQQPSTTMPAAVREKKMRDVQAREAAYRQKIQARQSLVQGGELVARQHYLAELGAIVEAIMTERGADAVVQKTSIVASVSGLDITHDVISRLDRKDPSFKVPLVNPPPSQAVKLMH